MFTELSPGRTGVKFKNILRETEAFNVMKYGYFYNGGGVAVGDVNNDGLPDLYFTGNLVASKLYLNQGDWKFKEVATEAGVRAEGLWNTGTTMADVNGDGWLDIYVCRSAAADARNRINLLFINEGISEETGEIKFSEQSSFFGLDDPGYSTQAAFFDYDRDGDLDMYLLNHSVPEFAGFSQSLQQFKNRNNPNFGDRLYKNEGEYFVEVADKVGILSNVLGFGLGIGISDVNQDDWPDIYVSNDYNEQDYLYINNQDGTFTESLEEYINHTSLFSMGSDIADINNDGLTDILTLDMLPEGAYRQKMSVGSDNYDKHQVLVKSGFYHQYMRNMLHLNHGKDGFSEIGQLAGVAQTDWSWAALFADYDNDGWKDLFITNGYKADYTNMDFLAYSVDAQLKSQQTGQQVAIADLLKEVPSIDVPNYLYHNNGGITFTNRTQEWGLDRVLLSNGAVYADLDLDGDLDLVTNNVNEPASLFRNNSETIKPGNYLQLILKGKGKNTAGIGAKVWVEQGDHTYFQELMPVRGFQSSVEPLIHVGLAANATIQSVRIQWPDGTEQVLIDVQPNQRLTIEQEGREVNKETQMAESFFIPDTNLLSFTHIENDYVDFKREPLLPKMLSTQGPKIAKGDVNGDGRDDLFIGGARGQAGALFIQSRGGEFQKMEQPDFEKDKMAEDVGASFFDADGDGDLDLFVASGGGEDAADIVWNNRLYLNNGRNRFVRSDEYQGRTSKFSYSCVRPADYNGDGDWDFFVGSRQIPGAFPQTPMSELNVNLTVAPSPNAKKNVETLFTPLALELARVGMVCDAQWVDINQDDRLDLVVVGDWMPISIWYNSTDGGMLYDQSDQWFPDSLPGWWNTIHAADLDNDGDLDLVVGNEGLNTQIQVSPQEPARLYAKDFDGNGSVESIMTYYLDGKEYPMPFRDDLLGQLVDLKKKYTTYDSYAQATFSDIFPPEQLTDAQVLEVNEQRSLWLENTGNRFIPHPLPIEAQMAPVYAIESLDINGDGHMDLVLGGNFSATRVQFGRSDANWGVLLLGDGKGNFEAVDQRKAGLRIRGDVRDFELVEVNGGQYLVVAVNDAPVQVYRIN